METHPVIFLFFWGQLPWNLISAEIKGSADSSPTTETEPWTPPPSRSEESAKNNGGLFTTKPSHPSTEEPTSHDGHLIASVLIGVILIVMIVVVVGIFLWRRWRKAASPLPHWAGRSPFADGDVPDVSAEKEATQGLKRVSVLSLLPWKLNKDTELVENMEGPLPESQQKLAMALPPGSQDSESCPTTTGNSDSSASMQTTISEEPGGMTDVPLQPDAPEPLPPPPNWLGDTHGDICPSSKESLSPPSTADAQDPVALDLSYQIPDETLPPPPEELLSN